MNMLINILYIIITACGEKQSSYNGCGRLAKLNDCCRAVEISCSNSFLWDKTWHCLVILLNTMYM